MTMPCNEIMGDMKNPNAADTKMKEDKNTHSAMMVKAILQNIIDKFVTIRGFAHLKSET